MNQDLAIWSPVIVASLESMRNYRLKSSYQLDENYKAIEDIRVRIKSNQAQVLGKAVKSKVEIQLICVLEDYKGQSRAFSYAEILMDRVPLQDLRPITEQPQELRYIHSIEDFTWDAEINGRALEISYNLTYNLLATREQIVQIQSALDGVHLLNNLILTPQSKDDLEQMTEENQKLRKQVYLYERDLISLKRGIQKAENHSHSLHKELRSYKDMVEELKKAIKHKDSIICSSEIELPDITDSPVLSLQENSLGKRIKKIFLNNQ